MEIVAPKRKKNRLKDYDYSSCGAYFLTICCAERKNYFWNSTAKTTASPRFVGEPTLSHYGEIVKCAIQRMPEIYPAVSVESYVIMPDHVHLLLMIRADEYGRPMVAPTISRIVQQLKGWVTKRIGTSVWQKLFFDHIIRDQRDYEEHVRYIEENPIYWRIDQAPQTR